MNTKLFLTPFSRLHKVVAQRQLGKLRILFSSRIMKLIFSIAILAVALTTVSGRFVIPHPYNVTTSSAKVWLVQTISFNYVDRLVKELQSMHDPGEAMATLLPPIDDPLLVQPNEQSVDIHFEINETPCSITGTLGLTSETEITGLGELVDNFELSLELPSYKVSWDLEIPTINVNGESRMDLVLDLGTPHPVHGGGILTAKVDEVFLHILSALRLVPTLGLRTLELDLGFKGLEMDGGEAYVDETLIDWERVIGGVQIWFDTTWTNNDEVKGLITEAVRCSADHVVNGCTLAGLIGGGTECLKVELNPECLELLFPNPDDPTTTTTESDAGSSTTDGNPPITTPTVPTTTGTTTTTTVGTTTTTVGTTPDDLTTTTTESDAGSSTTDGNPPITTPTVPTTTGTTTTTTVGTTTTTVGTTPDDPTTTTTESDAGSSTTDGNPPITTPTVPTTTGTTTTTTVGTMTTTVGTTPSVVTTTIPTTIATIGSTPTTVPTTIATAPTTSIQTTLATTSQATIGSSTTATTTTVPTTTSSGYSVASSAFVIAIVGFVVCA